MTQETLESLRQRWLADNDATSAAALARASLHQNDIADARLWALRALRADAHALPISTALACGVPLIVLPNAEQQEDNSPQTTQTTTLCAIDDTAQHITHAAIPLHTLPCPAAINHFPAVTDDGSVLALIDPDGPDSKSKRTSKPFTLYAFDPARHTNPTDPTANTELPKNFIAVCAAKYQNTLFVSGRDKKGPSFGWCHLSVNPKTWHWQPIKKPFDDLVVYGQTLVAVDNLIMPKYFFTYDISGAEPVELKQIQIPFHTSYEQVRSCAHRGSLLALLSSGINHGQASQFICLYDLATLTERWGTYSYRQLPWYQIALGKTKLLIAARAQGVLALDLDHPSIVEAFEGEAPPPRFRHRNSPQMIDSASPDALITPVAVAVDLPEGAQVVRVVAHPQASTAFALYEGSGRLNVQPFVVASLRF